jgi:LacI family transcriptional regulator
MPDVNPVSPRFARTHTNKHQPARITIRHVAAEAGVSVQTISRVINNHPDVSDATREQVQQIIAKLKYRPNGIARSLITQTSRTLGVVASGFQLYGPAQLLTGIEREATELGWHLLLQIVDPHKPNDYDRVTSNLISQNVDGVIWAYPELTGERERAFHQQVQPFAQIVFLSMEPIQGSPVLSIDNRLGARLATEHLIRRGYRHIGLISGPKPLWSSEQRKLGWEDALMAAKLPHGPRQIAEGDWSSASGDAGLTRLLHQSPKLDAVFASNDQMALGALKAAHRLGRKVPKELGVVGFDDMPESAYFSPALTTVHHDLSQLGQLAVRELSQALHAAREGKLIAAPASLMLQPWLVVRESA